MAAINLDFFQRYGETLLRNGYSPIPIKPGEKQPGQYQGDSWSGLKNWSQFLAVPPSREIFATWSAWPGAGVGLLTGDIVAVDIDVTTH
jgi:hypothetical protein